jgi:ribulose-5-phosphate 4-epimerase/fuculose-1-phosphate aldolase
VIPFSVTPTPLRPVIHNASFLHVGVPVWEIRDAGGATNMLVRDGKLGHSLAAALGDKPVALMRGHGNVVVGSSIKQAVVYAAYVDINARMQTQALLLSRDIVTMNEPELFKPEEFDINRPWEHLKQKTLDDAARAKVDRAQFGLDQTQAKQ